MNIDLRMPNITEKTPEGQLAQIRSYLYQFAEQLQWAFNSISDGETMESYRASQVIPSQAVYSSVSNEQSAKNTFSELKSLIIKSADIVEAYYKEFGVLLESEGKYVAVSDFGTYYENSSKTIVDKYDSIEQQYKNLQKVVDDMGVVVGELSTNALIRSGMLKYVTIGEYDGVPLYGIEIRQQTVDDTTGKEVLNKLAMLSSEGLELYANPDSTVPTAIFKHNTMYITNAEVSGSLKLGGYRIQTSNGLLFKWEGRA